MQAPASTRSADPADLAAPAVAGPAAPILANWPAVFSVAIGAFALVTTEFLPVGLLPSIAAELRVTEGMAGMMVTIPGMIAALAALLVTAGVGKADRRHVVIGLMSLLVASNIIVTLSDSFTLILLGRALMGIGVGGFWAIGGALGTRLVPIASAARATSIIFAGISLGTVAGVPAGAMIGELLGWRMAFAAAGVLAVVVVLTQMWLLPALPTNHAVRLGQLPQLLRLRKVQLGIVAIMLIFIGQFAAYTYVTPFLVQVAAMSAKTISALLLAYGAAGFVGNIIGGWAVAKSVRGSLIGTGLVLGLSGLALPFFGDNPAAVTALIVVWGLAFGAMPISVQSWMFSAMPGTMEAGGALFVFTAQVALASGALVGGLSVDHLGVSSAMTVGGLFALAMAVVIWAFGKDKPARLHAVH
ncbi:MFS transporter [Rugamonas rubra]|uniref:Predicted arabinose efflux permease, MFS family n=1 Tax=Rugamonas rubra TaxID=758825 RepID=A0A1I4TN78_9BURK|nr:MFS transporter [Rugamonas rubra]SFM78126.1 Predicted arabinose efflux permease, MFS family [Rugamonas rubra]